VKDGVVFLVDTGSTNGTKLNGEELESEDKVVVGEGDEIEIGNSTIKLEIERE